MSPVTFAFDNILKFATFLLLCFVLSFQLGETIMKFQSPFNLQRATVVDVKNKEVTVEFVFDKYRMCRVDLDRFIMDPTKSSVLMRDRVPGSPQLPGHYKIINQIPVPDELEPGHEYFLQVTVISQCSEGIHVDPYPGIRFIAK